MNVIANQANRTGRENRDGFGMKEVVCLLDRLLQLFFATENDVFLLHVGRKAVGNVVFVHERFWLCLVTPRQPCVETAPNWTVHNVDDVACWSKHHTFTASIRAAALGDDARHRADVCLHFRDYLRVVDDDRLRSFFRHLCRIFLYQLLPDFGWIWNNFVCHFSVYTF